MATASFFVTLLLCNFATSKMDFKKKEEFIPVENLDILVDSLITDDDNYTIYDMERLLHDKMEGYNKYVRPKIDQAKPLPVYASFVLIAFRELDEVNEKISIGGALVLQWMDEKMTWNTSEYGGIKTFTADQENFWTPMINMANSYHEFEKIASEDYWLIRFTYFGLAMISFTDIMTATCPIDVTLYPWDTQRCTLQFVQYPLISKEVQLSVMDDKIDMTYFPPHNEWDITDSNVVATYGNTAIDVHLTLTRKPLFILINTILPVTFMSFLNVIVFLIPTDSGERFSHGMTVLLAVAVFLTIISDNLPKSGKNVPVLCYYLLSLLGHGVLTIIGTTVSMRFYFSPEQEMVPSLLARLVHAIRCRETENDIGKISSGIETYTIDVKDIANQSREEAIQHKGEGDFWRDDVNKYPIIDSKRGMSTTMVPPKEPEVRVTWSDISHFLDTIFFNLSWLTLVIFNALFFGYTVSRT